MATAQIQNGGLELSSVTVTATGLPWRLSVDPKTSTLEFRQTLRLPEISSVSTGNDLSSVSLRTAAAGSLELRLDPEAAGLLLQLLQAQPALQGKVSRAQGKSHDDDEDSDDEDDDSSSSSEDSDSDSGDDSDLVKPTTPKPTAAAAGATAAGSKTANAPAARDVNNDSDEDSDNLAGPPGSQRKEAASDDGNSEDGSSSDDDDDDEDSDDDSSSSSSTSSSPSSSPDSSPTSPPKAPKPGVGQLKPLRLPVPAAEDPGQGDGDEDHEEEDPEEQLGDLPSSSVIPPNLGAKKKRPARIRRRRLTLTTELGDIQAEAQSQSQSQGSSGSNPANQAVKPAAPAKPVQPKLPTAVLGSPRGAAGTGSPQGLSLPSSLSASSASAKPSLPSKPLMPASLGSSSASSSPGSGSAPRTVSEFSVKKANQYGRRQDRILVIDDRRSCLFVLDKNRREKKDLHLVSIMQLDIPKSGASNDFPLYVIFVPMSVQRPFKVYFPSALGREEFCQHMVAINPKIKVEYEEPPVAQSGSGEDDPDLRRYAVKKFSSKAGVRRSRVVTLLSKQDLLRSFTSSRKFKDCKISQAIKIEDVPNAGGTAQLQVVYNTRDNVRLQFADAQERHKFAQHFRATWERLLARDFETGAKLRSEDISVFVGSWNAGGHPPISEDPKDRVRWLPKRRYDLYVVGLQECNQEAKREQLIADIKRQINGDWEGQYRVEDRPYLLVAEHKLWDIHLLVLVRRELYHAVTSVEWGSIATGVGNIMGNKGGVAVAFKVFDTSLCFVCTHLAARQHRVRQRADNYSRIVSGIKLGNRDSDLLQFEHLVWLGDLNYRIDNDFHEVVSLLKQERWDELLADDQLLREMEAGNAFYGFQEGKIAWAPTYRWDIRSNTVSNKRFQPPSYTDRILWRSMPSQADWLRQTSYKSCPDQLGSDHRPVLATFQLRPLPHYRGDMYKKPLNPDAKAHVCLIYLYEVSLRPVIRNHTSTGNVSSGVGGSDDEEVQQALLMAEASPPSPGLGSQQGSSSAQHSSGAAPGAAGSSSAAAAAAGGLSGQITEEQLHSLRQKHVKLEFWSPILEESVVTRDLKYRPEDNTWSLEQSLKLYPFITDPKRVIFSTLNVQVKDPMAVEHKLKNVMKRMTGRDKDKDKEKDKEKHGHSSHGHGQAASGSPSGSASIDKGGDSDGEDAGMDDELDSREKDISLKGNGVIGLREIEQHKKHVCFSIPILQGGLVVAELSGKMIGQYH